MRYALALLLALAVTARADNETDTEDLKAQEDPTILRRRVWLDQEWNHYKDNSNNIEETLGGVWSWRISAKQEWAIRLKVPLEVQVAGGSPGDRDLWGLGDIKLGTGTAFKLSDTWRAGFGLEMRFPSATGDDLGDDVWRLQEMPAIAWDVTSWLTLSPSAEINQSVAREHGGSPQNYIEIFFPATFILPDNWSVTPRYEAKVNFEDDNRWSSSGKLTIAKQLDKVPVGFALSIKRTFDGGDKEFQINFVTTYFFR